MNTNLKHREQVNREACTQLYLCVRLSTCPIVYVWVDAWGMPLCDANLGFVVRAGGLKKKLNPWFVLVFPTRALTFKKKIWEISACTVVEGSD